MKVLSSILPSEEIQTQIQCKFPSVEFSFYKGIRAAQHEWTEAEIFITYGEDLNKEYIDKANNLKWIMVMSAGMEKMPFQACKEKGIIITNAKGIHKVPMAEFTIGAMLQHSKQMKALWKNEENQIWDRRIPMAELSTKTLHILGIGAIGGEVARLAKAFGMEVIGFNRSGVPHEFADETYKLEELDNHINRADYIVSVLPSTPSTKGFLKGKHFECMKRTAVFINIGRGDVVGEEVIIKALTEKKIDHAFIDVFEREPLEPGHPFWNLENITLTPHISSITNKYMPRSFEIFMHNLHIYINKETQYKNFVDLHRGY